MDKITDVGKYLISELKINVVSEGDSANIYEARVKGREGNSLFISPPDNKGVPMPIKQGGKVYVDFLHNDGQRYTFSTHMRGQVVRNVFLLELDMPPFIKKSKPRGFYRVDMGHGMAVHSLIRNVKTGKMVRDKEYQVTCTNISGGGARFISSEPMEDVHDLEADLSFFVPGMNAVQAVVVRYEENKDGKYDVGIQFTSLKDTDRDRIVSLVFKRQIELKALKKN